MLDLEFTIREGKLYMLQTPGRQTTGARGVRIAVDMVRKASLSARRADRHGPDQLAQYLYPIFDSSESQCWRSARASRRDRSRGRQNRLDARSRGRDEPGGARVVLVRQETSPDDIHGMNAALSS
ncbi:MAG: hypothetical protein U0361_02085 [Nitrospiraceae bacterium]